METIRDFLYTFIHCIKHEDFQELFEFEVLEIFLELRSEKASFLLSIILITQTFDQKIFKELLFTFSPG